MLFHPLKKTLLSYNIYHNKLNWFNPTTSSWSVNQKITVDDNQHHNRFFDKDHDKLYFMEDMADINIAGHFTNII